VRNWFPLFEALIESEEFKALTVAERIHFLWLLSEFNRHGGFYRSDLEVAVTLGLSEGKVQRSRRRLQNLEWVAARRGYQSKGRNLATTYTGVRWAEAGDGGGFYAPMHRHAFETMLGEIRQKRLTHADVLLYVVLCYLQRRYDSDGTGDFFIVKRELRELSGLQDAPARVQALYNEFQFAGGVRLFEVRDECHRLKFTKWACFADPSENETSRKAADYWQEDIRKRVIAAKKQDGHPGQVKEDPVAWFRRVAGSYPGSYQAETIRRLAEKCGRAKFEQAVQDWRA
jgi:hypothetical protein